jgi:hypothetical protein
MSCRASSAGKNPQLSDIQEPLRFFGERVATGWMVTLPSDRRQALLLVLLAVSCNAGKAAGMTRACHCAGGPSLRARPASIGLPRV